MSVFEVMDSKSNTLAGPRYHLQLLLFLQIQKQWRPFKNGNETPSKLHLIQLNMFIWHPATKLFLYADQPCVAWFRFRKPKTHLAFFFFFYCRCAVAYYGLILSRKPQTGSWEVILARGICLFSIILI